MAKWRSTVESLVGSMKFESTPINGAFVVQLNKIEDERGFFSRIFCQEEFEAHGLSNQVVQSNLSHNTHKGTVRGMHYQIAPALETKLVRCIRGSIIDIIVDMRPESSTFKQHFSIKLDDTGGTALFVPCMCAHGFQTLEDNTDVMYMVSGMYTPECERGLRHDDPQLGIHWPSPVEHISDKDQQWPLLRE